MNLLELIQSKPVAPAHEALRAMERGIEDKRATLLSQDIKRVIESGKEAVATIARLKGCFRHVGELERRLLAEEMEQLGKMTYELASQVRAGK